VLLYLQLLFRRKKKNVEEKEFINTFQTTGRREKTESFRGMAGSCRMPDRKCDTIIKRKLHRKLLEHSDTNRI